MCDIAYLSVHDYTVTYHPFADKGPVLLTPVFVKLILGQGRIAVDCYSETELALGGSHGNYPGETMKRK